MGSSDAQPERRGGSDDPVAELSFRAMGSDIEILVVGGPVGIVDIVRHRVEELEQRWSRFLPTSEISRLNGANGDHVTVSADTRLLIERAIEGWRLTGGSYDPTLLDELVRAGYDRSFEQLDTTKIGAVPIDTAPIDTVPIDTAQMNAGRRSSGTHDATLMSRSALNVPSCTDIVVGETSVRFPENLAFDPGGIGKGLAADLAASRALDAGAAGVSVSVGGDLRVSGASPTGEGWTLAIEHPASRTPVAVVGLRDGAIATSSVLRRVWTAANGTQHHHLIDPSTGEPAVTDVAFASVIAGDAWVAEVLAKSLILRGSERAFDLLDGTTAGLIVDTFGKVTGSDRLSEFLGAVPLPMNINSVREAT